METLLRIRNAAILGSILALILFLIWWAGRFHDTPEELKADAERYVRLTLPKILTGWDYRAYAAEQRPGGAGAYEEVFYGQFQLEHQRPGFSEKDEPALRKKYGYDPGKPGEGFAYGMRVLGPLESMEDLRVGEMTVVRNNCHTEVLMKARFRNHVAYIYCAAGARKYIGGMRWRMGSLFVTDIASLINSFLQHGSRSFHTLVLPEL